MNNTPVQTLVANQSKTIGVISPPIVFHHLTASSHHPIALQMC
jgi:hypothetical protein